MVEGEEGERDKQDSAAMLAHLRTHAHTLGDCFSDKKWWCERQTDRQTDRQKDRQTDRQNWTWHARLSWVNPFYCYCFLGQFNLYHS